MSQTLKMRLPDYYICSYFYILIFIKRLWLKSQISLLMEYFIEAQLIVLNYLILLYFQVRSVNIYHLTFSLYLKN